jgi:hypothetical protein
MKIEGKPNSDGTYTVRVIASRWQRRLLLWVMSKCDRDVIGRDSTSITFSAR